MYFSSANFAIESNTKPDQCVTFWPEFRSSNDLIHMEPESDPVGFPYTVQPNFYAFKEDTIKCSNSNN